MRIISLILLSCLSSGIWAQETKKVKLKIYNADCIPEVSSYPLVPVSLYHLPENKFVFKTSENYTTGETTDEAQLPPGKYRAVYYNTVHQQLEREITLGQRDTAIGFCVDSLISYPLNTLACFKDNDSMVLTSSFSGCFDYGTEKVVIRFSNNTFTASRFVMTDESTESGDSLNTSKEKYKHVQTIQMNTLHRTAFRRFENEFIVVNEVNGGTTSVAYSINSPYLNITKGDEAVYWGGYRELCNSLFGRDEK